MGVAVAGPAKHQAAEELDAKTEQSVGDEQNAVDQPQEEVDQMPDGPEKGEARAEPSKRESGNG